MGLVETTEVIQESLRVVIRWLLVSSDTERACLAYGRRRRASSPSYGLSLGLRHKDISLMVLDFRLSFFL